LFFGFFVVQYREYGAAAFLASGRGTGVRGVLIW
jgi:hypothetical protein